ncbi:FtsK/SpoIIIE domain-containing protein [Candidatus Thiothrix sp. Deng01]|uniref:FtsK/SpoIIIE domain-containing protein n=1 Tax=Candidatus Thiothrix phosphatis TaxID=3112415 RepID=A0ABU6CUD8_9GAMM|nr:FtsK/SpoIIIE domain-containing protein [Candidatus Thiothrix sp. Deng01]MEB4589988.1 FtsK/SpoIIIE domain-containing protein [Candidatus Thiothrix sp. Deng01]
MNYRVEKQIDDAMNVARIGIMPSISEAVAAMTSGVLPASAVLGTVLGVGATASMIGASDTIAILAGVSSLAVLGMAHMATTRSKRNGWLFAPPSVDGASMGGDVCWDTTGVLRKKLGDESLVAEQRFADQYRVLVVRNDDPESLGRNSILSAIAIKHGLQRDEVHFIPVFEAGASAYLLPLPQAQWESVPFDHSAIRKGEPVVIIGRDIRGKYLTADLRINPHTITAGSTGSGKTEWTMVYIKSLVEAGLNPILYILDPNDNMGVFAENCGRSGGAYITSLEEGAQLLRDLTEEPTGQSLDELHTHNLIARKLRMSKAGSKNIWQYRKVGGIGDDARPVVIIIDEVAAYSTSELKKQVVADISAIYRRHRAAGALGLVSTQRPDTSVIPGELKANAGNIIAFSHANAVSSRVTLDSDDAAGLPREGGFVAKFGGSDRITYGRAAYLGD